MKNIKFQRMNWELRTLLSAFGLIFLLPNLLQAQFSPPESFQKKESYQKRTDRYVTLFNPDDLSQLSVLDKMKLTQSTESCTVEKYFQEDAEPTIITTFHQTEDNHASWRPAPKYNVIQDGHSMIYDEDGQLLLDMEMGETFSNMSQAVSAASETEGSFSFPTIMDYDGFVEPYLNAGFSVSEVSQGKVQINGNGLEMEVDFVEKELTFYHRGDEGNIESVRTVVYAALPTGGDVPVFIETVEYGSFACGVCFQKMTIERYFGHETVDGTEERSFASEKRTELQLGTNPVADRLRIFGLEALPVSCDVAIFDVHGQRRTFSVDENVASNGIDVSALPSGLYFFSAVLPEGPKTLKFVKL